MTRIIKAASFALLLGALFSASAHAATYTAASCNESDVASAISSATTAGSGNTVAVPSGTCTWTTALSVTLGSSISLSIIGAGSQTTIGGGDVTVIIDNVNHSSTDYTVSINTGGPSTSFRWSGITIEANGSSTTSNNGVFILGGTSQAVRVDHCHFYMLNQLEVDITTQIYGVFDHDLFDQADLGIRHLGGNWNGSSPGTGDSNGDGAWNDTTTLGSNRYVYVENSTFNSTSAGTPTPSNDCLTGGRFVFRYNTFTGGGALQTHPTGHAGDDRGCRAWEIYNNTFGDTTSSNPEFNMFFASAGTGVIWGNTVTNYQNFVSIHAMRADDSTYAQTAPPNGWGYCGTQVNGTGSNWDQNTSTVTGYACLDQPGRGKGDLLSGTFPTKCDTTAGCSTYTGTWPNDALEPIYEWMDSWTGASGYPGSFWNVYDTGDFMANRDYYLWCSSSSPSGCTSFTGAAGVGSGTLSARPATCTTGVGYWATDQGSWNQSGSGGQGELFVCTATNTWGSTPYYTPYTYPHPLTATTPPAPASNAKGVGY
jgi:hypothetical protein